MVWNCPYVKYLVLDVKLVTFLQTIHYQQLVNKQLLTRISACFRLLSQQSPLFHSCYNDICITCKYKTTKAPTDLVPGVWGDAEICISHKCVMWQKVAAPIFHIHPAITDTAIYIHIHIYRYSDLDPLTGCAILHKQCSQCNLVLIKPRQW
jgi:hypothetical protein